MLRIPKNIGTLETKTTGTDSIEYCYDLKHFKSYSKNISYRYNSRGFRDHEWPEDLSEVIWCIGDSFTVGIGQPFEETWPYLLEKKSGKRCINLGEDGCSNDTMALRAQEIFKSFNPNLIVIMWSYLHRRRVGDKNVHYFKKDFGVQEDIMNFSKNYKIVNDLPIPIINTTIPDILPEINAEKRLNYFLEKLTGTVPDLTPVEQVDWARDYLHFDIKTSHKITDYICQRLKDIS